MTDQAVDLLFGLVMDADGHRWGERATEVQRRDAEALLDRNGPRRHWIGRSRGYAKTDDLAAVTLAALLAQLRPGDEAIAIAAGREQARLVVDRMRWIAARTPGLQNAVEVQSYDVRTRAGVRFEAMSSDAPTSWGRSPSWTVVDELCQHPETAGARQVWESISTAAIKVRGRLSVITTAGSPAHWSRSVYENALADPGWRVSEVHGPAPWLDPTEVEAERRRLPESSYQRLFQNRWTDAENALATLADIRECVCLPGSLGPVPGTAYTIGVDLGLKRDRTVAAIVHAERAGAGVRVVLDVMRVWEGKRLRPVRLGDVEEWIAAESQRFNSARVVIDPWQAAGLSQRLRAVGVRVREFVFSSTSVGRLAATLHTAIRDHRLALPDDEALIEELASIRLRETSPGVLRMDHAANKHDDRGVALALASHEYLEAGLGQGQAFIDLWKREIDARKAAEPERSSARHNPKLGEDAPSVPKPGCEHRWERTSNGDRCVLCAGFRLRAAA